MPCIPLARSFIRELPGAHFALSSVALSDIARGRILVHRPMVVGELLEGPAWVGEVHQRGR